MREYPEFWPHRKRPEQKADVRQARTTPWILDDVREAIEAAALRRQPNQARRREMRLLFGS